MVTEIFPHTVYLGANPLESERDYLSASHDEGEQPRKPTSPVDSFSRFVADSVHSIFRYRASKTLRAR
jgi:predicted HicB family RNase H-like nuclease